jgi:hypothetical protein
MLEIAAGDLVGAHSGRRTATRCYLVEQEYCAT